ncbi:MAG: hypothetical protein HXX10_15020 [Rhodoplanes sp.]|uniref:hypothetical protein n=1 Tax=Rhodoplanes sp. TaxID=1968906 RepID=UPI0017B2B22E|nr:hypothetical protein [Rhodoplanes sp.]NVO15339.1 hypothetical protein [Rhodoplanes sp.]
MEIESGLIEGRTDDAKQAHGTADHCGSARAGGARQTMGRHAAFGGPERHALIGRCSRSRADGRTLPRIPPLSPVAEILENAPAIGTAVSSTIDAARRCLVDWKQPTTPPGVVDSRV